MPKATATTPKLAKVCNAMEQMVTNKQLEAISLQWFDRDLKERKCGDDFSEVAVWSIKAALQAAYEAGQKNGFKIGYTSACDNHRAPLGPQR